MRCAQNGEKMRTYLVTGGAGFIGSNYIHYMFKKYDNEIRIINVDALTYAPLSRLISVTRMPSAKFSQRMISTVWYILRQKAM